MSAALPPPSLASNTTSTSTADLEAEYFGGAASDQVQWLLSTIYTIISTLRSRQRSVRVAAASGCSTQVRRLYLVL